MREKFIFLLILLNCTIVNAFSSNTPLLQYVDQNHGYVSFDVSMPIDATGYTLHGKNLKGGNIQFTDKGAYITHFLANETGDFKLPVVLSSDNKPLIKTIVRYHAIKFIDPVGIDNLFIKVGMATRTQTVSGLDPFVLKDGTYTWKVPIFSVGKESDTVDHTSENLQFMQVGATGGPASHNDEYTLEVYLYSQGKGNTKIAGHPERTARLNKILSKSDAAQFSCIADGIWGSGGSDPYRTLQGHCSGSTMTFPAGPNLDYEYGAFDFPTVHSPWTGSPSDQCIFKGKRHKGCVNIKISSNIHYMAQKIRVPINDNISVYAEFGTTYRSLIPENLRYQCKGNVYLKGLLPESDCLKKNYLPGGSAYTYFAVGYEFQTKDGSRYSARYIYIPEQENANRLAWRDASDTEIYAISVSGGKRSKRDTPEEIRKNFNEALNIIRKMPAVYDILGKNFFIKVLRKNGVL